MGILGALQASKWAAGNEPNLFSQMDRIRPPIQSLQRSSLSLKPNLDSSLPNSLAALITSHRLIANTTKEQTPWLKRAQARSRTHLYRKRR